MTTWIIEDWAGNRVGSDEFDNYGDAREAIYELAQIEADNNYGYDRMGTDGWEELYQGVCEDLYAIPVDENGNELKNLPDSEWQI